MLRDDWDSSGMTPGQRWDNWWRYHWVGVLCAVLAAIALAGVMLERSRRVEYDCSVALVTRYAALPEEIESLRSALEAVCPDANGDGEVHVAVNEIQIDYTSTRMDDAAIRLMTTNVDKLNADFYTRQSGIFLLDDPENFQKGHGALAYLDGQTPPEGAADWQNMARPFDDWAGGETVQTEHLEPDALWFARRIVVDEGDAAAFAGEQLLWVAMFP